MRFVFKLIYISKVSKSTMVMDRTALFYSQPSRMSNYPTYESQRGGAQGEKGNWFKSALPYLMAPMFYGTLAIAKKSLKAEGV